MIGILSGGGRNVEGEVWPQGVQKVLTPKRDAERTKRPKGKSRRKMRRRGENYR